jgi:hypothetical protein
MVKSCSLAYAASRNCNGCAAGQGNEFFSSYKWFCSPDMTSYKKQRAAAGIRMTSRSLCRIADGSAQLSANHSLMKLIGEEKFDPSILPFMNRLVSNGRLSGFYTAISINCFRDICATGRFERSMLPFFDCMLRKKGKNDMYLAVESVRALFRNPDFDKGWLTQDNYAIILRIIGAMAQKPDSDTVPYPFYSFTSLIGSRGFSVAELPKVHDGMQNLNGIAMAAYFYSLEKERHPNAEPKT